MPSDRASRRERSGTTPSIRQEGPGSIPDATKDPMSAYGARACKIHDFESLEVDFYQFTMGVISGESFPPLQRQFSITEVGIEGDVIYRQRIKLDSCHCIRTSLIRRSSFALNSIAM